MLMPAKRSHHKLFLQKIGYISCVSPCLLYLQMCFTADPTVYRTQSVVGFSNKYSYNEHLFYFKCVA